MKKIMFGAMALISLSVAASAALTSSIPGITVTESSCDDGYIITSTREGVEKSVKYDSCEADGIVVLDAEGNVVGGESEEVVDAGPVSLDGLTTVNINGVDVYFPAGYTTPTDPADNTCTGGYNSTNDSVSCSSKSLSALSDGYLNLTSVGGHLSLHNNQLTNTDGLANLTSVGGNLSLYNNQLTNVDGLANLTSVVGNLTLDGNQLTNVDGLANLTSLGSSLSLYNNFNLQDLSGLNNLESMGGSIRLDQRDYSVKLDANSYICQNFSTKVISYQTYGAYPNKSDICYE